MIAKLRAWTRLCVRAELEPCSASALLEALSVVRQGLEATSVGINPFGRRDGGRRRIRVKQRSSASRQADSKRRRRGWSGSA